MDIEGGSDTVCRSATSHGGECLNSAGGNGRRGGGYRSGGYQSRRRCRSVCGKVHLGVAHELPRGGVARARRRDAVGYSAFECTAHCESVGARAGEEGGRESVQGGRGKRVWREFCAGHACT